jgi:hypothetical protein
VPEHRKRQFQAVRRVSSNHSQVQISRQQSRLEVWSLDWSMGKFDVSSRSTEQSRSAAGQERQVHKSRGRQVSSASAASHKSIHQKLTLPEKRRHGFCTVTDTGRERASFTELELRLASQQPWWLVVVGSTKQLQKSERDLQFFPPPPKKKKRWRRQLVAGITTSTRISSD